MTREEAKAAGVWRYNVGVECPHGHTTGFRTDTGKCTSCGGSGAIAIREWRKEWHERQALMIRWRRVTA